MTKGSELNGQQSLPEFKKYLLSMATKILKISLFLALTSIFLRKNKY